MLPKPFFPRPRHAFFLMFCSIHVGSLFLVSIRPDFDLTLGLLSTA